MALDRILYRLTYRFGTPRWDTGVPQPELQELVRDRAPGRALDLGCGTGADAVYLAGRGWDTTGIDFAPEAVAAARKKAADAGVTAAFVQGDASRLADAGVEGPFDLLLDIGCYHTIPASHRDAYVAGAAAAARPGAHFYLAGIADPPRLWRLLGAHGIGADEIRSRFGPYFSVADQQHKGTRLVAYHLVRNGAQEG
jgi:SAM-dependent methyltransferase